MIPEWFRGDSMILIPHPPSTPEHHQWCNALNADMTCDAYLHSTTATLTGPRLWLQWYGWFGANQKSTFSFQLPAFAQRGKVPIPAKQHSYAANQTHTSAPDNPYWSRSPIQKDKAALSWKSGRNKGLFGLLLVPKGSCQSSLCRSHSRDI